MTVNNKWETKPLGKFVEFRNGVNYNKSSFGEGIKVVGVKDFQDYIKPKYSELSQINPKGIVTERNILQHGDIVFVRSNGNRDLIGRSLFIDNPPEPVTHSAFTIRLRFTDKNEIDPRYYAYLLRSPMFRKSMTAFGGGTNISNLNQDILNQLEVPFPPYLIQRKITKILTAYDDLIENNIERLKILEEMARSLYREWFVYFRYPGHESVPLVNSSLGPIPKGWQVRNLGNLVEIKKGKNITKKTIRLGNVPVVAGGITPAYFHDTANTKGPVITISASGANAGFVNLYYVDVWASDCAYIDSAVCTHIYYYYLLFNQRRAEVTHLQRGSAQPHVYQKDLERLQATDVPKEVLSVFTAQVAPIFELMMYLTAQIENLRRTRDLLLPRLLSGQILLEEKAPVA